MYQDSKFSRFLFHLKFSQTEDFVHEHELYEVMRSRNLYQTQFGVRSNFKKVMKNLAKDEKQRRYGFENTRKLFVQRMKERREQTDKLRKKTIGQLESLSSMQDKKERLERRYVPLPQSTIVYTAFPPIESQEIEENTNDTLNRFSADKPDGTTVFPATPSLSMVATVYSDVGNSIQNTEPSDRQKSTPLYKAKTLVVGKAGPQTITKEYPRSINLSKNNEIDTITELMENELHDQLKSLKLEKSEQIETICNADNDFENKTKLGEGKAQISTVSFTDDLPTRLKFRKAKAIPSETKVKVWTEKRGVKENRMDIQKEADFQKFLIDRPSKWTLNNYGDIASSNMFDMRLQNSRWMLNGSFGKKSRQIDKLSEKLMLKQKRSLPELNTAPKPMVSLDPGGTTPDGKLILTMTDYQEYLSGYRKARDVRLERSKKRNRLLEKRIDNFKLEPKLCLRDNTRLLASL